MNEYNEYVAQKVVEWLVENGYLTLGTKTETELLEQMSEEIDL